MSCVCTVFCTLVKARVFYEIMSGIKKLIRLKIHVHKKLKKSFLPYNCWTYNMNDNPKNNILMLENIGQKRLAILEYFDAYICHHYQPKMIDW